MIVGTKWQFCAAWARWAIRVRTSTHPDPASRVHIWLGGHPGEAISTSDTPEKSDSHLMHRVAFSHLVDHGPRPTRCGPADVDRAEERLTREDRGLPRERPVAPTTHASRDSYAEAVRLAACTLAFALLP